MLVCCWAFLSCKFLLTRHFRSFQLWCSWSSICVCTSFCSNSRIQFSKLRTQRFWRQVSKPQGSSLCTIFHSIYAYIIWKNLTVTTMDSGVLICRYMNECCGLSVFTCLKLSVLVYSRKKLVQRWQLVCRMSI